MRYCPRCKHRLGDNKSLKMKYEKRYCSACKIWWKIEDMEKINYEILKEEREQ